MDTGSGNPGKTGPILIVDDDTDLRTMMEILLTEEGYPVMTAEDGRDALSKIEKVVPRLVFLDMKMPGMNGWEFAKEFRARYGRRIPLVVFTAAADAKARADEIDAEDYIDKPFKIDEIVEKVKKHAA